MNVLRPARGVVGLSLAAFAAISAAISGCGSEQKPKARSVRVAPAKDVDPVLRETVQAEVTFLNTEPVLVSGYGLVVNLKGTGGEANLPEAIAGTMEREMALRGISTASTGMSPRQMLQDPSVAVVVVQAAIPPGSPRGANFDVYVTALNASSLEGGTLWSTDLRIGDASTFKTAKEHLIGKAGGAIFVNPFAEPGKEGQGPTRKSGRVLGGGEVTDPVGIAMILSNTSHARARSIVEAINSRFPMGRGDAGKIARGVSGSTVELNVPLRYRDNAAEFLEIVKYLRFDSTPAPAAARAYVERLKADPAMSGQLGSALVALGEPAIPFARELYDYPEPGPRLTGLMVGAKLNDAKSAVYLRDIARSGTGVERLEAINLLGQVEAGPTVDTALLSLLGEKELSIRVAAYEALAGRAERYHRARRAALLRNQHVGETHAEALAGWADAGLHGIQRRVVGDKFLLDIVPVGEPLIYVTQQGRPRIVLFGENQKVSDALAASLWDERLLLKRNPGDMTVAVQWREREGAKAATFNVRPTISELIEFLARSNAPGAERPGLDLTYSEVVGVLDGMQQAGAIPAPLATEENKLKADLLAAASAGEVRQRPETPGEREIIVVRRPEALKDEAVAKGGGPRVVPIVPAGAK